jgi:hypothetical protein
MAMAVGTIDAVSHNPFSTRFVRPDRTAYAFPPGEDLKSVATDLINQLYRRGAAAIIGPHGTGKSTLLNSLIPQLNVAFADIHRIQLSSSTDSLAELKTWLQEQHQIAAPSAELARCLVIDGFEQLSWTVRQQILWQAKYERSWLRSTHLRLPPRSYLLVTAHQPQFAIRTFYRTGWDDRIVKVLTEEKLGILPLPQRLAMLETAERQAIAIARVRPAHRSVRDYWFSLYDEYERLRCSTPTLPSADHYRRRSD